MCLHFLNLAALIRAIWSLINMDRWDTPPSFWFGKSRLGLQKENVFLTRVQVLLVLLPWLPCFESPILADSDRESETLTSMMFLRPLSYSVATNLCKVEIILFSSSFHGEGTWRLELQNNLSKVPELKGLKSIDTEKTQHHSDFTFSLLPGYTPLAVPTGTLWSDTSCPSLWPWHSISSLYYFLIPPSPSQESWLILISISFQHGKFGKLDLWLLLCLRRGSFWLWMGNTAKFIYSEYFTFITLASIYTQALLQSHCNLCLLSVSSWPQGQWLSSSHYLCTRLPTQTPKEVENQETIANLDVFPVVLGTKVKWSCLMASEV